MPIFKAGDNNKTDPSNYRPKSLLLNFNRLLEIDGKENASIVSYPLANMVFDQNFQPSMQS